LRLPRWPMPRSRTEGISRVTTELDRAWPAESDLAGVLPPSTDVLVVGGGLAGTALAYYLARHGVEVVLVERGELNREASGTNAGSFHFQIAIHQLTSAETENVRDRLTTEQQLRLLHEKRVLEEEAGLEIEIYEGDELRSFAPYLAPDLLAASFCPQEGHADPALAAPLFALRAAEAGAAIRTHASVTAIDVDHDADARRFTVTTDAGRIHARRIVNASGAWANEIAALAGLRLPLRSEGLHLNVTEPREHVLDPMVQHIGRRLTLKQTANDTFIIGGGWPARIEPRPRRYSTTWESMAGNVAVAVRVMPLLADVRIVRTWSGVMAFTDDLAPVVGESRRLPGYHTLVATTGFTLSPLMARLLAESMATGEDTIPPAYAVDRRTGQPTPS
jgi:glycine/D-amino acid oxidase-like deaminating enzyme